MTVNCDQFRFIEGVIDIEEVDREVPFSAIPMQPAPEDAWTTSSQLKKCHVHITAVRILQLRKPVQMQEQGDSQLKPAKLGAPKPAINLSLGAFTCGTRTLSMSPYVLASGAVRYMSRAKSFVNSS